MLINAGVADLVFRTRLPKQRASASWKESPYDGISDYPMLVCSSDWRLSALRPQLVNGNKWEFGGEFIYSHCEACVAGSAPGNLTATGPQRRFPASIVRTPAGCRGQGRGSDRNLGGFDSGRRRTS